MNKEILTQGHRIEKGCVLFSIKVLEKAHQVIIDKLNGSYNDGVYESLLDLGQQAKDLEKGIAKLKDEKYINPLERIKTSIYVNR